MERSIVYFGNCKKCNSLGRLDLEGHCPFCSAQENRLIETTHRIFQQCPEIPRQEIAEAVGIDVKKVI